MKHELPKDYEPLKVEPKWQREWMEWKIYEFDWSDRTRPTYVIDTPPPYPSGEFHMGTALNWTYMDIVARYKRMRGYNVFFPQGWDCHGLPTEVQVEKKYKIRKSDLPPEKFRELCVKLTLENIEHMKEEMNSLGFSIDWSTEYKTMDPEYYGRTQLSFVKLYKKGVIYRGEHPVNWCPRCETAIADAEVEYEDRETRLYYIDFELVGGDKITIATTRPEFLPACVAIAVHPSDERYRGLIGKKARVPPLGQEVKIISDPEVDPEFGTGIVMICTFGDKTDVRWVKRHKLSIVKLLDERGKITEAGGPYAGMDIETSRRKIIEDLKKAGLVRKEEPLQQSVGVCWRCKTPVEILSKPQWFMRVLDLNDLAIQKAKEVRWVPSHMLTRFVDWARSMDWDWVISRQRVFATPIPAWYCKQCGEPLVADEQHLPITPGKDPPPFEKCPRCGGKEFEPERDVLDTWMDSSITIAVHAGWPNMDSRLFPADLQPNGTDIIRTWDYYLMVRHLALLGEAPYRTVLINGMVVGDDGRKMSKSLGNYVDTTYARGKWGADALRQWAVIAASTGADVPFNWKDVEFGHRFMRKFWNAARFAYPYLEGASKLKLEKVKLRLVDRWILSRYNRLVKEVTEHLENFEFNHALRKIHTFVWHELCDMYIEEVKHRLYESAEDSDGARAVLYRVILGCVQMLAPFIPHFAEEVFQQVFKREVVFASIQSVHLLSWPSYDEKWIDKQTERAGKLLNSVVSTVRQLKAKKRLSLVHPVEELQIYTPDPSLRKIIDELEKDICGNLKVGKLIYLETAPAIEHTIQSVSLNYATVGPKYRGKLKMLEHELQKLTPQEIVEKIKDGKLVLQAAGEIFELGVDDLIINREVRVKEKDVDVVETIGFPIVLIVRLSATASKN